MNAKHDALNLFGRLFIAVMFLPLVSQKQLASKERSVTSHRSGLLHLY